jgi:hypothetical protein
VLPHTIASKAATTVYYLSIKNSDHNTATPPIIFDTYNCSNKAQITVFTAIKITAIAMANFLSVLFMK